MKMIEELKISREVTYQTKWRDFVNKYKEDEKYFNMIG